MATQSETWVWGRWLAVIAGSNLVVTFAANRSISLELSVAEEKHCLERTVCLPDKFLV